MPAGSGVLSVSVHGEGRTRVIVVRDHAWDSRQEDGYSQERAPRDLSVHFDLPSGLGLSVVSAELSEVVYMQLRAMKISHIRTGELATTDFSIQQLQVGVRRGV